MLAAGGSSLVTVKAADNMKFRIVFIPPSPPGAAGRSLAGVRAMRVTDGAQVEFERKQGGAL